MSDPRIDLGRPAHPGLPYTHLLPLVEDLLRRGNRIARRDAEGGVFFSNQRGYLAILEKPLDIDYLQASYELSEYHYHPDQDLLFDARNWVSIYGSKGRLATTRGRRSASMPGVWERLLAVGGLAGRTFRARERRTARLPPR